MQIFFRELYTPINKDSGEKVYMASQTINDVSAPIMTVTTKS